MSAHRAAYLRRAIPRLAEQYKSSGVLEWIDEVLGVELTPWQRRLLPAWTARRTTTNRA